MTEQPSATVDETTELDGQRDSLVDDDDLVADPEFVATLQRRRLTTPLTRVLLILIVLGLGFLLGAYVQKHRTPSTSTGLPAGLAQLFGRNSGGQGALAANGGALTGTIKLVDGNNVYITDAEGNITKIVTTADTKITVSKDGTLADLGPSKTITVQGSQNADGTYSATSIREGSGGTGGFPGAGAGTGSPTATNGDGGGFPGGAPPGG
jgi:hypothetical protein